MPRSVLFSVSRSSGQEADRVQYFWKEKTVFSLSTALLCTLAHDDPKKVRGVLGQLIHRVLQ